MLPALPGCPLHWEGRRGGRGALRVLAWHGGIPAAWVGVRGLWGPGCWPWVQGEQGQLGLRECPSPWHLGSQTKGWLRSPELAPSECCPLRPPSVPLGEPGPRQTSRSTGRMPVGTEPLAGMPPPQSYAASPQAWPGGHGGPIRGHQEPTIPPAGSRAVGWVLSATVAGPRLPTGLGCPRDAGASYQGPGDGRGRWRVAGAWVLPRLRPPCRTPAPCGHCSSGLLMLSGGARKVPRSWAPAAGSAPCPWQCPLPVALGVQRRAPADSQLPVR